MTPVDDAGFLVELNADLNLEKSKPANKPKRMRRLGSPYWLNVSCNSFNQRFSTDYVATIDLWIATILGRLYFVD